MQRIALALTLSIAPAFSYANLVNGSFESPLVDINASGGSIGVNYIPNGALTGWQSSGHATVLFNTSYSPVADGNQAVQLEFAGDTLSQTFATSIGQNYLLSYELSGYQNALPSPLYTSLTGGALLASHTVNGQYPSYVTQTLTFTADSTSTTLLFRNDGPQPFGTYPHIDNVSVTAVPEPETYAMLLAGLGVVGFLSKRRSIG